jgi:TrmH family RNA methyltransferase
VTPVLTSEKNPLLKRVRRAVSAGSLTEDGFAVAESFHLLKEALTSKCEIQAVIVAESAGERVGDVKNARVIMVADRVFAELASTGTTQGVIALVKPPSWTLEQVLREETLAIVLDGVQDPGNAGAMVRAAEAFGATGAVFLKGSADPYHPKSLRGSAGSIFRLPVVAGSAEASLLEMLDRKTIPLYAANPRAAQSISEANFLSSCAIVIGSEGRGVSEHLERRATGVRIPTSQVESLNAAVAAGIMLYEARRQRSRR